jgi:GTPase SAR1 family protein
MSHRLLIVSKVLVVGSGSQGKTSLIQTLIDDQPTLTGEDRTVFFDVFEHAIDSDQVIAEDDLAKIQNSVVDPSVFSACRKELTLTIWDMSGNERYSTPQWHFIESQALVMIVFSLAEYDDQRFGTLIGNWIDLVIGKCSRLACVIIGTHADCVGKEAERIKVNVMNRVNRCATT